MKPFRRWIPRDEDRYQPRVMRLYFENGSWVGFRRSTRAPRGSYERHRVAKGEVQFGQAQYQFGGGLTEAEAGAILNELRAARVRFLVKSGHNESDLGEIACDDAIEFATNEGEA